MNDGSRHLRPRWLTWGTLLLAWLVLFVPLRVEAAPTPDASERTTGGDTPAEVAERETGELPRVESVDLRLTIWRGGEKRPDGERVRRGAGEVDAEAVYTLDRPANEGERLLLLNFAEFMREDPRHLDEIAMATYVTGPFTKGALDLIEVRDERGALVANRVGERRDVEVVLQPGTRQFTIRYRVVVPHRYWPFGCVNGRCSLSGAVAPLPSEPAEGGRWLSPGARVVAPAQWRVLDAGFGGVPGWRPGDEPDEDQDKALGRHELVVTDTSPFADAPVEYPSVFWGRRWHHLRESHLGVDIEVLSISPRPSSRVPDETFVQLSRDDAGHMMRTAKESVALAAQVGLEIPPGGKITLVQGPLRSQISESHPSAVVVSDQFLEIFPVPRVAKFHDLQLARSALSNITHGAFAGMVDPSTGLWLPGALSMTMTYTWQRLRALRDEYARDLLSGLTFVPSVDRLLYTGQAAFASAYFRGAEDEFPVRNHPLLFSHDLPTGRRIHEKLSDLLAADEVAEFYESVCTSRAGHVLDPEIPLEDPETLAERAYGHELDWFFEQWLGRYPEVDYAIERVESERTAEGWRTRIAIVRDAEGPVIEPVQVLVKEKSGKSHRLIWNGDTGEDTLEEQPPLARHEWTLETETKVKLVRLDPRYRLLETSRHADKPWQRGDNNDPRFNNRDPKKFRFLFTGVGLSVAASEFSRATTPAARMNALSGLVIFEASLQRDLRRTGAVLIYKDRETYWAVGSTLNFWFLEKRNRQRRRLRLSTGFTVAQVSSLALDPRGGMRLTESIGLYDDTRKFRLWPEKGHRIGVNVRASETLRLEGDRSDDRYALDVEGEWTQLWRIVNGQVLATHLAANMVFPIKSELEFRSLARGGGIGGIRGFGADELFGRGVAQAHLEYRSMFYQNARINAFHGAWIRSFGGVVFGGATTISNCEDFGDWFSASSWYGQLGFGLTSGIQIIGVTPQFIRLDAAIPIGRRTGRMCLGESFPGYLAERQDLDAGQADQLLPPFNINLTFTQPF